MRYAQDETLSVVVITRNHQDFIAEALESVHIQRDVEIDRLVVSDDCSTDCTVAVARDVIQRLEMKAEVLESTVQMGITPHYQELFAGIDTDLVAVLEGDDYWFDSLKLNRQLNLLRDYPYTSACALGYMQYQHATRALEGRNFGAGDLSILSTEDLVRGGDGFGFSNMVYRTAALRCIPPEFYSLKSYDWITNILVSREAPLVRLDVPGFIHRVTQSGAWAGQDHAGQLEDLVNVIESYLPHSDDYLAGLLRVKLAETREALDLAHAPARAPVAETSPTFVRRAKLAIKRRLGC
jgi:glycosyltransferase involved in cell wall biosynthesis